MTQFYTIHTPQDNSILKEYEKLCSSNIEINLNMLIHDAIKIDN